MPIYRLARRRNQLIGVFRLQEPKRIQQLALQRLNHSSEWCPGRFPVDTTSCVATVSDLSCPDSKLPGNTRSTFHVSSDPPEAAL